MFTKVTLRPRDKKRGLCLPIQMSQELAYLLGVLAGDGSLGYRESKKEYSLKCVGNPQNEKKFYKLVIQPLFKKIFGITPESKPRDSGTTFGIIIYSKTLVTFFVELGLPLGPKHPSLRIPEVIEKPFMKSFVRGVFDTDGCISFKKKYRDIPYYPVISFTSQTKQFTRQIASFLKKQGFRVVTSYDYHVSDRRNKNGFTVINRVELNGQHNLNLWLDKIGFSNPKHQEKIKKWKE